MNFAVFQQWRQQCLSFRPELLDCGETNLYSSLMDLRPTPDTQPLESPVHRCDLARAWLARYEFSANDARRALVCRGVRHALALIFQQLARGHARLWVPEDVYPVYLELARKAGILPLVYPTLPVPDMPQIPPDGKPEYLLVTNPWKPLGRYLNDQECGLLHEWVRASPHRRLLLDSVYDLSIPFHVTTRKLQASGRAIILHSVTKGWLWPKTFGVALMGEGDSQFESFFRGDSPEPYQLRLARQLLFADAKCPNRVAAVLQRRASKLISLLPDRVCQSFLLNPAGNSPGSYFFPVSLPVETLLSLHNIIGIPGSAFGGRWNGSVLTSLSAAFRPADLIASTTI